MSLSDWLTRHVTYPAHEWLRGRRTIAEMRDLTNIARMPRSAVDQICTDRLQRLLLFASQGLPYYANLFAQHRVDPCGTNPLSELAKLPTLRKADVRTNAGRMTYTGVPGGLQPCVSGGTSGDTLHFFVDRLRQSQSMGARLAMHERLGVPLGEPRIWLWGSPIEMKASRIRRWRDRLLREVIIDAFAMSPDQMDAYLEQIIAYQPRLIMAYTSAAALLAQHAARRYGPANFPWLKAVVMTGDEVRPEQRRIVSQTFGCPAIGEYGSREVGLIAYECHRGSLHVITPHVLVEITHDEQRVPPGTPGNIICTNLNTRAQPLIRYHLGDVGALGPDECACGLPFPTLEITGARITGFVALPGQRLCHGHLLAYMVRAEPCVVEFKVHQRALDVFEVLLVVDNTFTPAVVDYIKQRFAAQFGPTITTHCRLVDEIPPDPSGKRRHVISDVAPNYSTFEVVS